MKHLTKAIPLCLLALFLILPALVHTASAAEAAQARIGETTYPTLEDAISAAVSGDEIVLLTDVTVAAEQTVTIGEGVRLNVPAGVTLTNHGTMYFPFHDAYIGGPDSYTGDGIVRVNNEYNTDVPGKIFQGKLYHLGDNGKITATADTSPTYFPCGDGYAIYDGANGFVLNNATGSYLSYVNQLADPVVTITFIGKNSFETSGIAPLSVMHDLVLVGQGDGAELNLTAGYVSYEPSIALYCHALTLQSGTVTAVSVTGEQSYGISAKSITIAQGAVLNAAGGEVTQETGVSAGIVVGGDITANGTLNVASGHSPIMAVGILMQSSSGNLSGNINATVCTQEIDSVEMKITTRFFIHGAVLLEADLDISTMDAYLQTAGIPAQTYFAVPADAGLTVNPGVILDLSGLPAANIDFSGTVVNNGTIKLPADFDLANAPTGGNITLGQHLLVYENNSWHCVGEHELVYHEAQAPTITQVGWEAYESCAFCDYTTYQELPTLVSGDINGDRGLSNDDVILLMWHVLFPADNPVTANADLNHDGSVNNNDVILLMWHILFPEENPLT